MSGRKKINLLIVALIAVALSSAVVIITALYQTSLAETRLRLSENAQFMAQLLESSANNSKKISFSSEMENSANDSASDMITELRKSYKFFKGFSKTGEFILSRIEGDQIVFLLPLLHLSQDSIVTVPLNSQLAEPSRRALRGLSGTMTGLDYSGELVLAAYEPVKNMNIGVVAKIDVDEIRAPFVNAGLLAGVLSLLLIFTGSFLISRVGNPLVKGLKENLERYELAVQTTNDGILDWDLKSHTTYMSPRFCEILGYHHNNPNLPHTFESWVSRIHPADHERVTSALKAHLEENAVFDIEYKHLHMSGEYRWQNFKSIVIRKTGGKAIRMIGCIRDISEHKQAEAHLQMVTNKLKLATKTGGVGIWDLDIINNKLSWDEMMYRLYGTTPDRFGGAYEAWQAGVHPDDLPQAHDEVQLALKGIKDFDTEFRVIWPDGSVHYIKASASVQYNSSGQPISMLGTNWDITALKKADEALKESRDQLTKVLCAAQDAIIMMNPDGEIAMWNDAALRIFGYSSEEALGQNLHQLLAPNQFHELHFKGLSKFRQSGHGQAVGKVLEFIALRKGGLEFPIELSLSALQLNGQWHAVGIVRDITERKQSEKAIKESENEYKQLFNRMIDGFALHEIIYDEMGTPVDYCFLAMNPAFERLTGLSSTEFLGKRAYEAIPNLEPVWLERYGSVVLTGEPIHFEEYSQTLQKHFEVTAYCPEPGQFACIVADITERKRLQEQERRAHRLETIGQVASEVAHDLNNMLLPIMTYPDIIRDELPPDHPAMEYLAIIEDSARQMADINEELLTLGRRGHFKKEPVNLNAIVKSVLNLVQADSTKVKIEVNFKQNLPKINGGASQLHRAIMNLVVNAQDAVSDGGLISIYTEICEAQDLSAVLDQIPTGDYVKLTIKDSGCGIPDDIKSKIFDPFFSTKKTDKRHGSGLGMSVVQAVVKDHEGFISLQSEVGRGTEISLCFPTLPNYSGSHELKQTISDEEGILTLNG